MVRDGHTQTMTATALVMVRGYAGVLTAASQRTTLIQQMDFKRPRRIGGSKWQMATGYTEQWLREYQAKHRGLKIEIVDAPKPNKYSAIRTEVDGIIFDSKREAKRYQELRQLQLARSISDLRLKVKYELIVNGQKIGSYTSDFEYEEGGKHIVEDCKGYRHRDFIWRKKLMLALYGISIRET